MVIALFKDNAPQTSTYHAYEVESILAIGPALIWPFDSARINDR